jgi:hypothetical protein
MIMIVVVAAAAVQECLFPRYNNFLCRVDHFLISCLGRFQSSCGVSGMAYCKQGSLCVMILMSAVPAPRPEDAAATTNADGWMDGCADGGYTG